MDVQIRLASGADFDAAAALTNWFIRNTPVHFGDSDVTARELEQQSQQPVQGSRYPWLACSVDGRFAGYAKASGWRSRAAYDWTTETTVYLEAHCRGHGLGRRLYGRLLAMLAAQGFRSAIGGIALPNDASVRLHEALGFVACGTVRAAGYKFGRWHDVGFWQLDLQRDAAAGRLGTPEAAFAATAR